MSAGVVVDSSAVVAMLTGESEAEELAALLQEAGHRVMSAATLVEVGIVLEARYGTAGSALLHRFVSSTGIEVVPVDRTSADAAVDAWRRFGKGRHPAALNFGDCFTYALADASGLEVLCTGDDFVQTDLTVAGRPNGGQAVRS